MISLKKTVRVDELAADWKVNPQTIRREIDRGNLGAFKVGDTWRIPVEEVEKYRLQAGNAIKKIHSD